MEKIYLASGFFNDFQLNAVERAEKTLRNKHFDVFSPREHQFTDLTFGTMAWRMATFNNDIEHIDNCDYVVAILDNDMDEGTLFEIGYAFARNKQVILIDLSTKNSLNLMVSDSIHAYLTSLPQLNGYDFSLMPKLEYDGKVI
jgi:nucleoside 2-deoxyribosyltransferase